MSCGPLFSLLLQRPLTAVGQALPAARSALLNLLPALDGKKRTQRFRGQILGQAINAAVEHGDSRVHILAAHSARSVDRKVHGREREVSWLHPIDACPTV